MASTACGVGLGNTSAFTVELLLQIPSLKYDQLTKVCPFPVELTSIRAALACLSGSSVCIRVLVGRAFFAPFGYQNYQKNKHNVKCEKSLKFQFMQIIEYSHLYVSHLGFVIREVDFHCRSRRNYSGQLFISYAPKHFL